MLAFTTLDKVRFKFDEEAVHIIERTTSEITFDYFGRYDVYMLDKEYILHWTGEDFFARYRIDKDSYDRLLELGIPTEDPTELKTD
jgi:hypothetical protein